MSLVKELKKIRSYIGFPLTWRKSDYAVYRELAAQDSTIAADKLLRLEFNPAALKDIGLTDAALPHNKVNVRGFWQDPETGTLEKLFYSLFALGYTKAQRPVRYRKEKSWQKKPAGAAEKDYNSIYLNRALIFNPLGQGLAALNVQCFKMTLAAAAAGSLRTALKVASHAKLFCAGMFTPVRRVYLLYVLAAPFRSMAKVMGHENIHLLQKFDRDTWTSGIDMLAKKTARAHREETGGWQKRLRQANAVLSIGITEYLMSDYEIQARLHTVIAEGSHRWGRLPKNKAELWTALDDCGLHMPGGVRKELAAQLKTDPGASAFQTKKTVTGRLARFARAAFSPDVAELRAAQASMIKGKLKTELWSHDLPYFYGHLLELYGQGEGRRMMGFDEAAAVKTKIKPPPFPENTKHASPAAP